VQDIKDLSPAIEKFLKNGAYSTAGSMQKLTENKDLYDKIISVEQGSNEKGLNETITRAQLFEILFTGVPDALEVAKQQGLLTGDSKGNYNENKKLTREELAVIIYKVSDLSGKKLSGNEVKISDLKSVSTYARERVQAVVNSGVMKLDGNGIFNPRAEVTAADIQTILTDLMSKLNAK